jgi:DNA-binding MarR family transcriptional regulator
MGRALSPQRVSDFLGSVQVFSTAMAEVIEEALLREVSGGMLTRSQLKLLKLIAQTDAHSIGDVAAFLGVSNAAASKAVDKLVRRGWVGRAEGATDRRAAELSLTPRSQQVLSAYDSARDRLLAQIFQSFRRKQLDRTAETLDRLSAFLLRPATRPDTKCFQCGIYFREECRLRKLLGRRCLYIEHKPKQRRETTTAGADSPAG